MEKTRATHLLYLHGFRSSPRSAKAQLTGARVRLQHPDVTWWCPQLPPSPREAMAMVMDGIAGWPTTQMAVVGSSLGGFYATHVSETLGCRAALLNPAVDPARDLKRYIGDQTLWHDPTQSFVFEPGYVDELLAMTHGPLDQPPKDPSRYYAIIAKGDEVLDWHEMTARYRGASIRLLEGGDHAISDFSAWMDELFGFLNLG